MSQTYSGLPNSNFPDAVDNFDLMQDLTTATKTIADAYNALIAAGNISGAASYLNQHPELASSVFNAQKYNNLRDAIIAVEKTFKDDIGVYLETLTEYRELASVDGGSY